MILEQLLSNHGRHPVHSPTRQQLHALLENVSELATWGKLCTNLSNCRFWTLCLVTTQKPRKMELIDQSTGSKRRTSQKTEPSRERSGSPLRSTLATGAITARRVSVFSFTKTKTSMKACGLLTNATARVLTGRTKVTNCVVNTRATGTRIKSTGEEPFSIKMGIVTMATG